jgi:hypothetical protein
MNLFSLLATCFVLYVVIGLICCCAVADSRYGEPLRNLKLPAELVVILIFPIALPVLSWEARQRLY